MLLLTFLVAAPPSDFASVKAIFAKHCISCHGPSKQKSGLRLDLKADAMKGGDSGIAFKPKDANASLLLELVSGKDPDRVMPPSGKRLTDDEVATIKAWIDAGADWPDDGSQAVDPKKWWSFQAVVKPNIPALTLGHATPNPIDAFIAVKHKELGLKPTPQADKRTLIRRLSFDLTGLPPTPEEVDSFLADRAPDAYEKLVDRLLASPQYGERWARHWLDVVHYGETHGYDKDQPRPNAWPYRDYVIRSFNDDKPYDRFVKEQIAGDRFFPLTADGHEALGFLSAGPWDLIGHAELPESKIDGKIARHLDRDDMVANTMSTFVGLTVHCAQCHNHKFDPVSQEDYYRLQAVFAAVDRADKPYDRDPAVAERRTKLDAVEREQLTKIAALESKAGGKLKDLDKQLAELRKKKPAAFPVEFGYHSDLATKAETTKWVQVHLPKAAAAEKIVLRPCHDDFGGIGDGFGFPVRFKVEAADDADFKTNVRTLADFTNKDQPNPKLEPVEIAAEGKPIQFVRVTATKLAKRLPTDFNFALAELEVLNASGSNVAVGAKVTAEDSIEGRPRWSTKNLTDGKYPSRSTSTAVASLEEKRKALIDAALSVKERHEYRTLNEELERIGVVRSKLPPPATAYIAAVHFGSGNFTGTHGKPRPIHLLPRGDVTKPGKEVVPGSLESIPGVDGRFQLSATHNESERRAALANWIVDRNNPLTWRVIVNRVWQYHFGRGLADTPNDFGRMGTPPTHPELLDWLAAEFRDHGKSLKQLHKLIVTSDAYKRSSAHDDANAKIDADNRFLWRQNRRKLEAEAVRDSLLLAAGKLDLTMGGPSFQDFKIEKPEHSPHYQYHLHDPESPASWRRSIYRFIVRSKQQPFLTCLDCADPSLTVEKRNETITPQQALALLNNDLSIAMSKHFAERLTKFSPDDSIRATQAFRLALSRNPTDDERDALASYAKQHGWPNACRVVFNLNEFAFVD
jgi:mono/diheme cytochrome c family protein